MIVLQITIKETKPGNVAMQASGGHVEGETATEAEVKAADQIVAGLDPLFRSIGAYTEVRPTTIISRNVTPPKPE
jgi:hypothetical protein